jgi:hypothetical protein
MTFEGVSERLPKNYEAATVRIHLGEGHLNHIHDLLIKDQILFAANIIFTYHVCEQSS